MAHPPLQSIEPSPTRWAGRWHALPIAARARRAPYAVSQLCSVFEAILAASGDPVLFHCTIGRDRNGITTAYVLLRILGVSRGDAMKDYLASNVHNTEVVQSHIEFYESLGMGALVETARAAVIS
ncbi:tyrosine-protein phosphatase [Nocardioides sp. NPDC087217]|uniref:tyrosine-protein phosphatase n=1 Tax=Nocardioides sp. NPDC087217 TaxID=3364335 RepID=UPI0038272A81